MAKQPTSFEKRGARRVVNAVRVVESNRRGPQGGFNRALQPESVPFPCTVVTVHDDYLTCRPINSENDENDFLVAKPWELRRTPFDGLTLPNKDGELLSYAYTDTQARTVTDTSDSSTEDQVIVPAYVPAQTVGGDDYTGTQITVQRVSFGPDVVFSDDVEIAMEDMNRAGRAWAEDNGS